MTIIFCKHNGMRSQDIRYITEEEKKTFYRKGSTVGFTKWHFGVRFESETPDFLSMRFDTKEDAEKAQRKLMKDWIESEKNSTQSCQPKTNLNSWDKK